MKLPKGSARQSCTGFRGAAPGPTVEPLHVGLAPQADGVPNIDVSMIQNDPKFQELARVFGLAERLRWYNHYADLGDGNRATGFLNAMENVLERGTETIVERHLTNEAGSALAAIAYAGRQIAGNPIGMPFNHCSTAERIVIAPSGEC